MHPHPYWKQNSIAALPSTDSNQGQRGTNCTEDKHHLNSSGHKKRVCNHLSGFNKSMINYLTTTQIKHKICTQKTNIYMSSDWLPSYPNMFWWHVPTVTNMTCMCWREVLPHKYSVVASGNLFICAVWLAICIVLTVLRITIPT